MTRAIELAVNEITLVLFTTLAPAGILACVALALALGFGRLPDDARSRLAHCMVVPLVVALIGLVASATQLGTPSNALYVLTGVGRSPLSNEVAWALVFLALCGSHWLYSFSLQVHRALQRVWCAAIALSGCGAVVAIGFAYQAPTILTWGSALVPVALASSALGGAPLLVAATVRMARISLDGCVRWVLLGCGVAASVATVVLLGAQWHAMGTMRNALGTAAELVPIYPVLIGAYGAGALGAYGLAIAAYRRGTAVLPRAGLLVGASVAYFAGLFAVRFGFYMAHMTVGISL